MIEIEDGVISAIVENYVSHEEGIELGDLVVMPGIIDPHVHINEPGRTEWEGFETATKAAIAGGITTLIEMPLNASPVTTTVEAFEKKLAAAKDKLNSNCGFWGGVVPGNEKEIEPLIERGVFGFKAFLTHSGIDEFPNVNEEDLRKVMPIISNYGLPLLVHAELPGDIPDHRFPELRSYQYYLNTRPKSWENDAIALMIKLCREFKCRTHIVHLSSADSIDQIMRAKDEGLPLTVETAQHYLYFNAEEIPDGRTEFKCAPPIRERVNNERLWQALKDSIIDFVATDHSPAPPAMKEMETGDIMKAWGGITSIQFALPVLWTAAKKHDVGLEEIARWLCSNSSVLAGLDNNKGKIEKGFDADIIVWDPDQSFLVEQNNIFHRHKITPYLGESLNGVVKQTWLNGELVYDEGKFLHLNKGNILLKA